MTPTSRSLAVLRELGYTAEVVEHWIPHTKTRKDLFGVIDIVAASSTEGILGVQATTGSNHAARVAKARAEPRLGIWLAAGARFEVWSFAKQGPRGKRKVWTLRREAVSGSQGDEAATSAPG